MFKLLPILAAVTAFVPAAQAASILASCGFEVPTYQLGMLDGQDAWSVYPSATPGCADVVTSPRKSGYRALKLDQSMAGEAVEAVWNCNALLSPGQTHATVEWDMRIEVGAGYGWFVKLTAANGAPLGSLWIDGGNLWYKVWSLDPQAGNGFLNERTWGHFRIELDWAIRSTAFYLDDQLIGSQGWHHAPTPGVASFAAYSLIGGTTDVAGFDNIVVSVPTAACPADFDRSGFVDTDDYDAFVLAFEQGIIEADFDASGFVDTEDFDAFVRAFEAGC